MAIGAYSMRVRAVETYSMRVRLEMKGVWKITVDVSLERPGDATACVKQVFGVVEIYEG
jgi:hypothetical protein